MEVFERVLGIYTVSILKEGKRWMELKSASAFLNILSSVKKMLYYYYLGILSWILISFGLTLLLTSAYYTVYEMINVSLLPSIILGSVFLFLGIIGVLFSLDDNRWLDSKKVLELVGKNMEESNYKSQSISNSKYYNSVDKNLSEQDLDKIVERLLNRLIEIQKSDDLKSNVKEKAAPSDENIRQFASNQ